MALDWSFYDHQREQRGLAALNLSDRLVLEAFAAEAIGLSMGERQIQWGRAEGYGLYATAVLRVYEGLPRRFCSHENIAIKIFHSSADKIVRFQKETFPRIWRPPLQRTLYASVAKDPSGKRRGYLILEFAEGDSLESLLKERLSREYAGELLEEFLHKCLIPLWAYGFRFWDFRPANLVVRTPTAQMVMIDTDALAGGAEELLYRPKDWTRRNQWEALAFTRLPGQIAAILGAGSGCAPRALHKQVRTAIERMALFPALHILGRDGEAANSRAMDCSERLINELVAGYL
jgi:hypothetical protein